MFVIMPNRTKMHVNNLFSPVNFGNEVTFCQLISELTNKNNALQKRLEIIKIIEQIGPLARDALPALKTILLSNDLNDRGLSFSVTNAIAKIDPISSNSKELDKDQQKLSNIDIDIIQSSCDEFEDIKLSRKCNFCEKEAVNDPGNQQIIEKLCPPGKFFCSFCLRNNYHTKDNRNVLMVTFRAIIGYYYYEFYQFPRNPIMYLSEIQDYVKLHENTGLLNPVFNYDPESYIWFIDFRKIGDSKKKIQIQDIYSTTVNILAAFNLSFNVKNIQISKLYAKYQEAIKDFYEKRYRPVGKKVCAPTLKGCGFIDWDGTTNSNVWPSQPIQQNRKFNIEDTKNFLPFDCKYWQKPAST